VVSPVVCTTLLRVRYIVERLVLPINVSIFYHRLNDMSNEFPRLAQRCGVSLQRDYTYGPVVIDARLPVTNRVTGFDVHAVHCVTTFYTFVF
jgi:hypothetical protein